MIDNTSCWIKPVSLLIRITKSRFVIKTSWEDPGPPLRDQDIYPAEIQNFPSSVKPEMLWKSGGATKFFRGSNSWSNHGVLSLGIRAAKSLNRSSLSHNHSVSAQCKSGELPDKHGSMRRAAKTVVKTDGVEWGGDSFGGDMKKGRGIPPPARG
ncbi:MAG TPA: hypothetical protein PK256_23960 [Verrucomicrobiota bacterium]|nr:hypothetical protein [Verrucomicrobiota bacterium]